MFMCSNKWQRADSRPAEESAEECTAQAKQYTLSPPPIYFHTQALYVVGDCSSEEEFSTNQGPTDESE